LSTIESLDVAVHAVWLHAAVRDSSPADPSCNLSEVNRLLWTVLVVAAAAGVVAVLRPTSRRVAALVAAALTWAWIDMEGPVLVTRGSHGLHFADLPVIVALAAGGAAALRLVRRRRHTGGGGRWNIRSSLQAGS
jgi:hypothetical protein